ncbi:MAG: hypothetical protein ACR2G6_02120, partial [Gemmatimonadaceae bacterium]
MKSSRQWALPVLVTLAALACTKPTPQTDTQADVAAINGVREREMTFVSAGNTDSLVTVYATPAQSPVPIEKEPRHHLKFENQYVRVFYVFIPLGDTTLFHTHV